MQVVSVNEKASAGTGGIATRDAADIRHWPITESSDRGGNSQGDCVSLERSQGRVNCQTVQMHQ